MILSRSDALLILDRLPDLILLLDDNGSIYYVNQRAIEILGDRDSLIGKQFYDLIDKQDLERLPDKLEDLVEWRSYREFFWKIRIRRKDGQIQLVGGNAEDLSTASELEANNSLRGMLITLRLIEESDSKNIRRDSLIAAVEAADSSIGIQNDLTERILGQQELAEKEEILNSFFDATNDFIGIVELPPSAPIHHTFLNDRAAEFFQVDRTLAKITIASLDISTEIKTQWQSAFEECWQTQKAVQFDCEVERLGELYYLQVTIDPLTTASIPCCSYVARDITQLQEARTHLMLMKAAVENIQESIVITTSGLNKDKNQPKIIYVNKAFTQITGYKPEEAIGKTPRMLQGDLTDPAVLDRLRTALNERQSFKGETINYRQDGKPFVIEWNIDSIQNEDEETSYWVAAQRNVTRRRQLEKEVLEIQAREQERIARDLHDSVQQKLNAIVMVTSLIQHQLDGKLTPQLKKFLDRLLESSRQASKEVKELSHSLYPVNIGKTGLMTALQHLSTTTKEVFNVRCEFTYEQPVLIADTTTATHLYRIVLEAVSNAVHHGKATQILIGLAKYKDNKYTLTVSDNGIGISDEALQEGEGMGLNSMRYRAEFIAAKFKIERGKENGTVVSCVFDYENIPEIDSL